MKQISYLLCALIIVLAPLSLTAQVGVNNNDPEQTLDVNGKVKIGNDDTTPSDGTVRYNDIEEDFQGYADGEWQSLTKSNSPTVDLPIPAIYTSFDVPSDGIWSVDEIDMRETWGNSAIRTSFTDFAVPPGYMFVVDQICIIGRDGSGADKDAFFYSGIRRQNSAGNPINPQIYISGNRSEGPACIQGSRNPVMILSPGQQFEALNGNESEANIRVLISGAFVTDLRQYYAH